MSDRRVLSWVFKSFRAQRFRRPRASGTPGCRAHANTRASRPAADLSPGPTIPRSAQDLPSNPVRPGLVPRPGPRARRRTAGAGRPMSAMTGRQPRAIDAACATVISWTSGSAWRCASRQPGPSRRKTRVTRSDQSWSGSPPTSPCWRSTATRTTVAERVALEDLQIRLATAAEIPGKRFNGLVRGVKSTSGPPPDGAISM
jgi:hypothetical protein